MGSLEGLCHGCLVHFVKNANYASFFAYIKPVTLLPLCPASLMHEKCQRHKIIHGTHPVGHKERSMDLKNVLVKYPVRVISVAFLAAVV